MLKHGPTHEFDTDQLSEFTPLSSDTKPTGSFFSRLLRRPKQDENDGESGSEPSSPAHSRRGSASSVRSDVAKGPATPTSRIPPKDLRIPGNSGRKREGAYLEIPSYLDTSPAELTRRTMGPHMSLGTPHSNVTSESNVTSVHPATGAVPQSRTLSGVLRRLNSILDRKGAAYRDSDFKQYWMPDDTCNECYECNDKFTTFRRRHHCRICGQIFCSRCCNQEVPGRIFGYKGDLRVCTYCCRVVLSYAQQTDASGDLRSLREDLRSQLASLDSETAYQDFPRWTPSRRKTLNLEGDDVCRPRTSSLTETDVLPARNPFDITPQNEFRSMANIMDERRVLTKNSLQLRELWLSVQSGVDSLPMTSHRLRLRTYHNCFTGKDLVDWLAGHDRVTSRDQGCAIGQALLDAKLIENIGGLELFRDEYMLYRAGEASLEESQTSLAESLLEEEWEPNWTKEIQQMDDVIDAHSDDETLSIVSTLTGSVSSRTGHQESLYRSHFYRFKPDVRRQVSDISLEIRDSVESHENYPSLDFVTNHRNSQEDLLSGALVGKGSELVEPDWWKSVHSGQLHEADSVDKLAYDRLRKSHFEHLSQLVGQLLVKHSVSHQWSDLILQLACRISEMVHPDVKGDDDDMDIRQYVQIKKICGGHRKMSTIIHGAVFSKNLAHKKMKQQVLSPRIMLLKNSIVFQRVENKFSSLEPQILQEKEYLRNCIAKVASLSPDVLLVEKTVSKLAKDFILEAGIALLVNVKPSVMERVARFTQADIISSIDGLVSRPRLGVCHTFRIQTFPTHQGTKSYAYFEGCATHLGCTVILRGEEPADLAKVKRILTLLVYASYHSRLETSYIMDENGLPAPATHHREAECIETGETIDADDVTMITVKDDVTRCEETVEGRNDSVVEHGDRSRSLSDTHPALGSGSEDYTIVDASEATMRRERLRSLERAALQDYEESAEVCRDRAVPAWSDPLTVYQRTLDETVFDSDQLTVRVQDNARTFKHYLDETILTVSPYLRYEVPYLLGESGSQSRLRQYFPHQLYHSDSFCDSFPPASSDAACPPHADRTLRPPKNHSVEFAEPHSFVVQPLIGSIFDKKNQALMADYRARGGQIRVPSCTERQRQRHMSLSIDDKSPAARHGVVDCLDIERHQRIAVLFSSYSYQSLNAPNPCISPWVVTMNYYGSNDMTLGNFLERLCFRESYSCPNELCDTPMIDHIRKFVHESGCIAVVLRKLDPTALSSNSAIVMWNWCRKCKKITPPVPISTETWSMSFAKYLELRFHGSSYTRRAMCEPACQHALHHDHYQYFGFRHTVAALKYMHICLREVALPPLEIRIIEETFLSDTTLDDTKQLAVSGYGVFSKVLEYLCSLGQGQQDALTEQQHQLIKSYHAELETDRLQFRQHIEQLQQMVTSRHVLQEDGTSLHSVTSSATAGRDDLSDELTDASEILWAISDEIVAIKRLMSQTVLTWNNRIQDLVNVHKKASVKPKLGRDSTPPNSLSADFPDSRSRSRPQSGVTECEEMKEVPGNLQEADLPCDATRGDHDVSDVDGDVSVDSVFRPASMELLEDSDHDQIATLVDSLPKFYLDADSHLVADPAEDVIASLVDERAYEDDGPIQEALHGRVVHDQAVHGFTLLPSNSNSELSTETPSAAPRSSVTSRSMGSDLEKSIEEAMLDTCKVDGGDCGAGRSTESGTPALPGAVPGAPGTSGAPALPGAVPDASGTSGASAVPGAPTAESTEAETANTNDSARRPPSAPDNKKPRLASSEDKVEKKTMKQFLSAFLSGNAANLLSQLYPPEEHHLLPPCRSVPVLVYDKEPSSIIAYALGSQAYESQRQSLKQQLCSKTIPSETSSPQLKRAALAIPDVDSPDRGGGRKKAVLSFFRSASARDKSPVRASEVGGVHYTPSVLHADSLDLDDQFRDDTDFAFYSVNEEKSKGPNPHIELQFSDSCAKFFCRAYYAQQFRQLRKLIFPAGEDRFIRSLSRCAPWMARGGKSGSYFCKTLDDRFVLKQMSRLELQSFLEFAPHYFQYVTQAHAEQRPTVLAKIAGVYRIVMRNSQTNTATKQDLLVIENVFYGRKVTKRFDLKGSMRNRLVNTAGKREEELVLLDENLLKLIVDHPLYIRPHTKTVLTLAITHDTQFLSSHLVMDYSLLVGIDDNRKELVLGIIDYMRTFTWDKKLEMVVKSSGILGGQGKMPTVISPELYRTRFLEAMDSYFPLVPDRWYGLGQNVDT